MSNRARIFAAVTLLIGCLADPRAFAQVQNLEAGKSPSQLFAGTCNACHKSPRGLLKTVSPGSLPGFLREHYTTNGDMASQLAAYLISNGAGDARQSRRDADKQGQGGNELPDRQGRKNRNAPSQEAARPDDTPPPDDGGRQGRRRQARPGGAPEEGRPVANAPAQADIERGPDGRKLSAKQRGRLGKPSGAEEPSVANEPPKAESGTDDKVKSEARPEMGNASTRPDAETKAGEAAKSESAKSEPKIEATQESASGDKPPAVRDPAPLVAPAPSTAASSTGAPAATSAPSAAPAIAAGGSPQPAASGQSAPTAPEPSATTASVPPPTAAAGPPAPPISR